MTRSRPRPVAIDPADGQAIADRTEDQDSADEPSTIPGHGCVGDRDQSQDQAKPGASPDGRAGHQAPQDKPDPPGTCSALRAGTHRIPSRPPGPVGGHATRRLPKNRFRNNRFQMKNGCKPVRNGDYMHGTWNLRSDSFTFTAEKQYLPHDPRSGKAREVCGLRRSGQDLASVAGSLVIVRLLGGGLLVLRLFGAFRLGCPSSLGNCTFGLTRESVRRRIAVVFTCSARPTTGVLMSYPRKLSSRPIGMGRIPSSRASLCTSPIRCASLVSFFSEASDSFSHRPRGTASDRR